MQIPRYLQHGEEIRNGSFRKINQIIEYLKTQRIVSDGTITIKQLCNGLSLSAKQKTNGMGIGSADAEKDYPFRLYVENSKLKMTKGYIYLQSDSYKPYEQILGSNSSDQARHRDSIMSASMQAIPLSDFEQGLYIVCLALRSVKTAVGTIQIVPQVFCIDGETTDSEIPCLAGYETFLVGWIEVVESSNSSSNTVNTITNIQQNIIGDITVSDRDIFKSFVGVAIMDQGASEGQSIKDMADFSVTEIYYKPGRVIASSNYVDMSSSNEVAIENKTDLYIYIEHWLEHIDNSYSGITEFKARIIGADQILQPDKIEDSKHYFYRKLSEYHDDNGKFSLENYHTGGDIHTGNYVSLPLIPKKEIRIQRNWGIDCFEFSGKTIVLESENTTELEISTSDNSTSEYQKTFTLKPRAYHVKGVGNVNVSRIDHSRSTTFEISHIVPEAKKVVVKGSGQVQVTKSENSNSIIYTIQHDISSSTPSKEYEVQGTGDVYVTSNTVGNKTTFTIAHTVSQSSIDTAINNNQKITGMQAEIENMRSDRCKVKVDKSDSYAGYLTDKLHGYGGSYRNYTDTENLSGYIELYTEYEDWQHDYVKFLHPKWTYNQIYGYTSSMQENQKKVLMLESGGALSWEDYNAGGKPIYTSEGGPIQVYEYSNSVFIDTTNLEIELSNANTSISELNTSVSDLQTSVGNLETTVSGLETSVGNLQDQVSSLETQLYNMDGRLSALENKLNIGDGVMVMQQGIIVAFPYSSCNNGGNN